MDRALLAHDPVHDAPGRPPREHIGERRVPRRFGLQRGAMQRGRRGFGTQEVRGPGLYARGAQRDRGLHPARIRDAARGDHGHLHSGDDLRHERERADLRRQVLAEEHAAVAARFDALRDDRRDAVGLEPPRFVDCRGRSDHERAPRTYAPQELGGGKPEMEAHDLGTVRLERIGAVAAERCASRSRSDARRIDPEFTVVRFELAAPSRLPRRVGRRLGMAEEVHVDRTARARANEVELLRHAPGRQERARKRSQAARFAHRGGERTELHTGHGCLDHGKVDAEELADVHAETVAQPARIAA